MDVQSLRTPFGISVFGSAIIRVEPDVASLKFAIARVAEEPENAFRQTREAAQQVQEYLDTTDILEVASSRIMLSEEREYKDGKRLFLGYRARIDFNVLLGNLDLMEDILTGVVGAGANHIEGIELQTRQLKELRAEARRRAVAAAREKADLYCQAAGVKLGHILHIEDVNPQSLRGGEGHTQREPAADEDGPPRALNPGSIAVGGAVILAFSLA